MRQKNHPNPDQNLCKSARSTVESQSKLWYGPARARAGTHAATALAAVRRLRPGRPCGPCTRSSRRPTQSASTQSASTLRTQNLQLAAQEARRRPAALFAPGAALGDAGADRVAAPEGRLTARRAREPRASARDRASRVAHRPDDSSRARLRMLYEQGNVEPLEIVFGAKNLDEALSSLDNLSRVTRPERGRPPAAEDGPGAARRHLEASWPHASGRSRAPHGRLRRSAASLAQTRAARASYIASLAAKRRLNESQISSLVAAAQAAQVRTERLATAAAATPPASAAGSVSLASATVAPPAPVAGAHELTVTATGYSLSGTTATGLPVGWGVVAVDPSIIPLGTHMTIPGYGEAVAADTGGSVVGATIDLWFPIDGAGERLGPAHGHDRPALRPSCNDTVRAVHFAPCQAPRSPAERRSEHPSPGDPERPARGRPRPVSDGSPQPARGAGRPGRRRVRERHRCAARGARARARRRRDGSEHAGDQRRRGDAPDLDDRAADARARADDLGSGQRRDGRDPRRRVRLPA